MLSFAQILENLKITAEKVIRGFKIEDALPVYSKNYNDLLDALKLMPSGGGVIEILRSELESLQLNQNLIPGALYLIKDLDEPLLISAVSTSKLDISAISPSFNQDIIQYNTETQGSWYISYRKDTIKNLSTFYDFRTIKWKRWETSVGSGVFTQINDPGNGEAFLEFYTFGNNYDISNSEYTPAGNGDGGACKNINIPKSNNHNNVFGNNCISVYMGDDFSGNTISNGANLCYFGNKVFENIIDNSLFSVYIGNEFSYNRIGNNFSSSSIGSYFTGNVIGNNFAQNVIGNSFFSNIIGGDFSNNYIGNSCNSNTIGNFFINNQIGHFFLQNAIGQGCVGNIIGNDFNDNSIGVNFLYNRIGNDFAQNIISNSFSQNFITNGLTTTDFSSASVVYQNFVKKIETKEDNSFILYYIDSTNTIIYTSITT